MIDSTKTKKPVLRLLVKEEKISSSLHVFSLIGEVQVVVAMRRITRLGIGVPIWDTFYNILPTSNPYNYYQELSRIRTLYEGKPMPLIRDFIDDPEREARGAIIGTMTKRNQVYIEQGFEIRNAAFIPKKLKRLSWGRRTRHAEPCQ